MNIKEYLDSFKSNDIKTLFSNIFPIKASANHLFEFLGLYYSNRISKIELTQYQLIKLLLDKYSSLGGEYYTNKEVQKINIEKCLINSILIDNKEYKADYYISCIDPYNLMDIANKYRDKLFVMKKEDPFRFLVNTNLKIICSLKKGCITSGIYDINNIKIGVNNYDYLYLKRNDNRVIFDILVSNEDYMYWKVLSKDSKLEEKTKQDIGNKLVSCFKEKYNITLLVDDIITPLYYENEYNSYLSSITPFIEAKNSIRMYHNLHSEEIKNLYFSNQWYGYNGFASEIINSKNVINEIEKEAIK